MFAYRFNKDTHALKREIVDIPEPKEHEVLARTLGSGVCHTDLHIVQGDFGELPHDVTIGHEGVGVVEKLGPSVQRFKLGDYVGVAWIGRTCLDCEYCKHGEKNLCLNKMETGYTKDGSHAEYFVADERFVAKLPKTSNITHFAPVLCAGVTSLRAVNRLGAPKGSCIVITGANGGLGLMAIQYAKALGLKVIAMGRMNTEKIQRAKDMGADFIVDSLQAQTEEDLVQLVSKYSSPTSPILGVLVLSPDPKAIETAVDYIDRGGTIVSVILPKQPLTLNLVKFTTKELTLRSSLVGTPEELQKAVDMMAAGKIKTYITEKPFDYINDAISALSSRAVAGRIVLTPTDSK